jgi:glucose/arabinose dehydrogenase
MRRALLTTIATALMIALGLLGWLALSERSARAGIVGLDDLEAAPVQIRLEPVVTGLTQPVYAANAGDGSGRLYLIERAGVIHILDDGTLLDPPFLDLSSRVKSDEGEQGMFSLAFHPEFADNGRLFISYTAQPDGRSIVAEVTATTDGLRAVGSLRTLFEVPQPTSTHNGGQIAFGPDGYLYVGFGDGMFLPSAGPNVAQDLTNHLGTIARVEVDGWHPYSLPGDNPFVGRQGVLLETWAYGLRNPWRFSFDRETGDLYVGDVGEGRYEEIDLIERGGNYGWYLREGGPCRVQAMVGRASCLLRSLPERYRPPLVQIPHQNLDERGGNAIVGGYVYRGSAILELDGVYLFGDFTSGRLWGLWNDGGTRRLALLLETGRRIVSFGEDEAGEVYVVDMLGEVLKIAPGGG